jgi:hypothetical protein
LTTSTGIASPEDRPCDITAPILAFSSCRPNIDCLDVEGADVEESQEHDRELAR